MGKVPNRMRLTLPLILAALGLSAGCGASSHPGVWVGDAHVQQLKDCLGTTGSACDAVKGILSIPPWRSYRPEPGTFGYYGKPEFDALIAAVCQLRNLPDEALRTAIGVLDGVEDAYPWPIDSRLYLLNRALMDFPSPAEELGHECLFDCGEGTHPGIRPLSINKGGRVGFAYGYPLLVSPFPYNATKTFDELLKQRGRRPLPAYPGGCTPTSEPNGGSQ